jgi:hypothetical protein
MTPRLTIVFAIETRPQVRVDCVSESEELRLHHHFSSHPDELRVVELALALANPNRDSE